MKSAVRNIERAIEDTPTREITRSNKAERVDSVAGFSD